jgi:hypothetical protein
MALALKMNVDTEPESAWAWIGPENYVDDAHLARIIALLEENTCWVVEKAEE